MNKLKTSEKIQAAANLMLWNQHKQPPESALKTIEHGHLQGLTDINDQWRLQALTEMFGPVGIGWAYDILKLWTEPGCAGEVCAFAHINMSVKTEEGWCTPFHGTGGARLIRKTTYGLVTNDDAFKMAITDALSVCCKELGIGADIYLGMWESKRGAPASLTDPAGPDVTEGDYNTLKRSWAESHPGSAPADESDEMRKRRLLKAFHAWADPLTSDLCLVNDFKTWSKEDLINCQQALAKDTKPQPQEAK
jgi:hypothetical protein